MENVDKLLEEAKGNFDAVVIAGFDNAGNMKMFAYPDNPAVAHWILSRIQFELNLHEKTALANRQQEQAGAATDAEVAEEVANRG